MPSSLAAFSAFSSEGEAGHCGQSTVFYVNSVSSTLHPPLATRIQCAFLWLLQQLAAPWGDEVGICESNKQDTPHAQLLASSLTL